MASQPVVIVGASLAGASAAATLRDAGYSDRIVLVGAEPHLPYERPGLSKAYLAGTATQDSLLVRSAQWYPDHNIELRLATRATRLQPSATQLELDSGETLSYSRLLLTTGSAARRLSVPGSDLRGIHYLRDLGDADRLRDALAAGGRRVVVIGGGWIGLETAAAARDYGNAVTVIEAAAVPLQAVLGPELGTMFAALHRDHGVHFSLGSQVREVCGSDGQLTGVVTERGDRFAADVVIAGVGVVPDTELARAAGLAVDNGVLVDASLRTSQTKVYAAGDIANAFHPRLGKRLRVEHWANARTGGAVAARAMLGQPVRHDALPYFFSDQYELGMEYTGYAGPGDFDRVVYRGKVDSRQFIAFWLAGQRIVAAMNVNVWDVSHPIAALIRGRVRVDPAELADPDVPLDRLAAASPESAA